MTITIIPDDNGPVDVEHVEAAAKFRDENLTIEQLNKLLSKCKRPAMAHLGWPQ